MSQPSPLVSGIPGGGWQPFSGQGRSAAGQLLVSLRIDSEAVVRSNCIWAFGPFDGSVGGSAPAEIFGALVDALLHDGESSVRDEAKTALEQLEDPLVLERLQTLINDGFIVILRAHVTANATFGNGPLSRAIACAPHIFSMPQRTVRFTIRPDGRVEERVEGVAGETCQQLTERLEAALGTVERREPTSDVSFSPRSSTSLFPLI